MKVPGPDYVDYWQSVFASQRFLKNRFGIRVHDGCCLVLIQMGDEQPGTHGKAYHLPIALEELPIYARMIVNTILISDPSCDLVDVLTGAKRVDRLHAGTASARVAMA